MAHARDAAARVEAYPLDVASTAGVQRVAEAALAKHGALQTSRSTAFARPRSTP